MRIAIFSRLKEMELEKDINAWLKNDPSITIVSQSQSSGIREGDGRTFLTIAIIYESDCPED
jgi:hypothetical protein